jgi:hypothetical protein
MRMSVARYPGHWGSAAPSRGRFSLRLYVLDVKRMQISESVLVNGPTSCRIPNVISIGS